MSVRTKVISAALATLAIGWAGAAATTARAADYGYCDGGWCGGYDVDVAPPPVVERRTVIERRVVVERPAFIERRAVVVAPPRFVPGPYCRWC